MCFLLCRYKGSGKFQLIAGIGLNVDNETDAFLCVNQVLRSEKRTEIRREDLLALILPRLTECYSYIGRTGGIQDEYYRYWLHSGKRIPSSRLPSFHPSFLRMCVLAWHRWQACLLPPEISD